MTSSTAQQQTPVSVDFGNGITARFSQLAGDGGEGVVVEYRHGNDPIFYPIKMPGLGRVGNVVLRNGVFPARAKPWLEAVAIKAPARRQIAITLLDGKVNAVATWTLNNAWPTLQSQDIGAEGNEVAVESLDVAFETLTISAP